MNLFSSDSKKVPNSEKFSEVFRSFCRNDNDCQKFYVTLFPDNTDAKTMNASDEFSMLAKLPQNVDKYKPTEITSYSDLSKKIGEKQGGAVCDVFANLNRQKDNQNNFMNIITPMLKSGFFGGRKSRRRNKTKRRRNGQRRRNTRR